MQVQHRFKRLNNLLSTKGKVYLLVVSQSLSTPEKLNLVMITTINREKLLSRSPKLN